MPSLASNLTALFLYTHLFHSFPAHQHVAGFPDLNPAPVGAGDGAPQPPVYERLHHVVMSSAARKRFLTQTRATTLLPTYLEPVRASLKAREEFLMPVSLGTPPQTLPLVVDTGSDLVWVPCTPNFDCEDCNNFQGPIFEPNRSTSVQNISCHNSFCAAIDRTSLTTSCKRPHCANACSAPCLYAYYYGTGVTAGVLQRETLTLHRSHGGTKKVSEFVFGCSYVSDFQTFGIAGFGQGALSFPSQLKSHIQHKFAYCLVSHRFDDTNTSSPLLFGRSAVPNDPGVRYTPIFNNPAYSTFYYVGLEGISVAGTKLNLPSSSFDMDPEGNGGTIIDSGTVLTQLEGTAYDQVLQALKARIPYPRSNYAESRLSLELCYNFSSAVEKVAFPRLPSVTLHFKGNADLELPTENLFFDLSKGADKLGYDVRCLMMQRMNDGGTEAGPATIIGNFQQQNLHILYDREGKRIGFVQRNCSSISMD